MNQLGRWGVFASVAALVLVRFFTETLGILPRFFNAIDFGLLPLVVFLVLGTRTLTTGRIRLLRLGWWLAMFCFAWLWSSLLNYFDVLPIASVLFLAGHLLPIVFGIAIANLPPRQQFTRRIVSLLIGLAVVGMLVGISQLDDLAIDADRLVFTFGTNPNQTSYFIALVLSVLFARWYFGLAGWRSRVLALLLTPFFFLSGFKSMWVLYPLVLATSYAFLALRNSRNLRRAIALVVVFVGLSGSVIAFVPLPDIEFFQGISTFDLARVGKVRILKDMPEILTTRPWGVLVGVGPGTTTSRAFQTFADLPMRGGYADVTYALIRPTYMTEIAREYVLPLLSRRSAQLGSTTIVYPYSSYISLLAETGLLGFAAMMAVYWLTWLRLMKLAQSASRPQARALALAAAMGILTLLVISVIDNYLENTRMASLAWLLVGLALAEVRSDVAQHSDPQRLSPGPASVPTPVFPSSQAQHVILAAIPSPPPYAGPEVVGGMILENGLPGCRLIHVPAGLHRRNAAKGGLSLMSVAKLGRIWFDLVVQLARQRPPLVYLNLSQNVTGFLRDALFIMTAWCFGARIVGHLHGGDFQGFYQRANPLMRRVVQVAVGRLTRVIVLAERHRAHFAGLLPAERVRVLYNAVSISEFDAIPPPASRSATQTILFVGHLSQAKGFGDLLEALPHVLREVPAARFVVAGEWIRVQRNTNHDERGRPLRHDEPQLRQVWKRLCLAYGDRVEYVGVVSGPTKVKLYRSADILVMPSYTEGFGLVALEAMAAGLPLIVTPVGALPEVLQPNTNAIFVEPGDVAGLIKELIQLLRNEDLRIRMGKANRQLLEREFTGELFVSRLSTILTGVFGA